MGDLAYGKEVAQFIAKEKFDIVLSGNTPTEARNEYYARRKNVALNLYSGADFYSIAATQILSRKLSIIGTLIGRYYQYLEKNQFTRSTSVIHITEHFKNITTDWGIADEKVHVIPNWGPIESIPVLKRANSWSEDNCSTVGFRYLYSGTLALNTILYFAKACG